VQFAQRFFLFVQIAQYNDPFNWLFCGYCTKTAGTGKAFSKNTNKRSTEKYGKKAGNEKDRKF